MLGFDCKDETGSIDGVAEDDTDSLSGGSGNSRNCSLLIAYAMGVSSNACGF